MLRRALAISEREAREEEARKKYVEGFSRNQCSRRSNRDNLGIISHIPLMHIL